ncbi:MAG TPA: AbrB/MazE/SpoVT family DNA-binding domain-containing protein [Alphaproteobacteria bacterium]
MKTIISKWGHSLALRIPSAFAHEIDAVEGTEVDISVSRGKLVVSPARRRYAIEDLVNAITPENTHAETEWGRPRGGEVW